MDQGGLGAALAPAFGSAPFGGAPSGKHGKQAVEQFARALHAVAGQGRWSRALLHGAAVRSPRADAEVLRPQMLPVEPERLFGAAVALEEIAVALDKARRGAALGGGGLEGAQIFRLGLVRLAEQVGHQRGVEMPQSGQAGTAGKRGQARLRLVYPALVEENPGRGDGRGAAGFAVAGNGGQGRQGVVVVAVAQGVEAEEHARHVAAGVLAQHGARQPAGAGIFARGEVQPEQMLDQPRVALLLQHAGETLVGGLQIAALLGVNADQIAAVEGTAGLVGRRQGTGEQRQGHEHGDGGDLAQGGAGRRCASARRHLRRHENCPRPAGQKRSLKSGGLLASSDLPRPDRLGLFMKYSCARKGFSPSRGRMRR